MWEEHMDRMEKKRDEFMKFIESKPDEELPKWLELLNENYDEPDAVDAFIEEELENEDFYFDEPPGDEQDYYEDDWDDDIFDEDEDFFFYDLEEDEFFEDDFLDDFDEGEEWKELSDDFTFSDYGSIENFELYNRGYELSVYALKWAEKIGKEENKALTEFVSNTLIISAKLAGGYSFGFEKDFIGGNIACTKKALNAANRAITVLQNDFKKKPFMSSEEYKLFHVRLFELRNDIGIYIQELRERFELGLD